MGTLISFRIKRAFRIAMLPAFVLLTFTSCGNESQTDYAKLIEGNYSGTVNTGSVSAAGITQVTRLTDTRVDLHITAGTQTLDIPGVRISNSGDDIYYLSYNIVGHTLEGNVNGDQLTYTLTSGALNGTFSGIRQP